MKKDGRDYCKTLMKPSAFQVTNVFKQFDVNHHRICHSFYFWNAGTLYFFSSKYSHIVLYF